MLPAPTSRTRAGPRPGAGRLAAPLGAGGPAVGDEASWSEKGVTFRECEMARLTRVMTSLCKMVTSGRADTLNLSDVANVLLESRKLLTPHQGKALHVQLLPHVKNQPAMDGNGGLLAVLSAFLSDPKRWHDIGYEKRHNIWNDQRDACSWFTYDRPGAGKQPSYGDALRQSFREERSRRVTAAACLAQELPGTVRARNGSQRLPALPRDICMRVLDLIEVVEIKPHECGWCEFSGSSFLDGYKGGSEDEANNHDDHDDDDDDDDDDDNDDDNSDEAPFGAPPFTHHTPFFAPFAEAQSADDDDDDDDLYS